MNMRELSQIGGALDKRVYALRVPIKRQGLDSHFGFSVARIDKHSPSCGLLEWLSKEEVELFDGFESEKRRNEFVWGRYVAKHALAQLCVYNDPTKVSIVPGVFGHPVLKNSPSEVMDVSISHSDSWAASIAFSRVQPMGVDVESVNSDRYEDLSCYVTRKETDMFSDVGISPVRSVEYLWAMKEAFSKVIRCGLTAPMRMFEVSGVDRKGNLVSAYFENFIQYKSICFRWHDQVIAISIPRRSRLYFPSIFRGFDLECGSFEVVEDLSDSRAPPLSG